MKIHRRDLLLASSSILVAKVAGAEPAETRTKAAPAKSFYLSPHNPIANVDQRDLERMAIQLQARPDVQAAIKRTADMWARVTDHTASPELWAMFPEHVANYCFRSILMAVNSDPNFPKVLRVYSPAGRWMGTDVPASKWGAENPDNCYRIVPVQYGGRYVIHGQRQAMPPSYVTYQLVADTDTSITVGSLEQRDMDIASNGSFVITVDETPSNGRKNHIQLTSDALYVFVRDSMGDWRQTPDALTVERINSLARDPLTADELAARAARIMHTGVYFDYYCIRLVLNVPAQSITKPIMMGAVGGLVSQLGCTGRFDLKDDEAAVISVDALKADYHSLVLYDLWARSLDYRNHLSHLNNADLAPDADGRITSVVSIRDPGVHNWLDTTGLHEVQIGLRWQGLANNALADPNTDLHIVKLTDLASVLPKGVRMVTPAERARQIAERQKLFDRRFMDS